MEIIFYKSKQEQNLFPKTLTEGYSVSGTLRSECDILNPIITFEGNNFLLDYNYAYMPDFKRYYFITDITSVRNGIVEIAFHVDVLNSWSNEILQHDAFIERNEDIKKADLKIIDDNIITYPNKGTPIYFDAIPVKYTANNVNGILAESFSASPTTDYLNHEFYFQGCVILRTMNQYIDADNISENIINSPRGVYNNSIVTNSALTINTSTYVMRLKDFSEISKDFMNKDLMEDFFGDALNTNIGYIIGAWYCPLYLYSLLSSQLETPPQSMIYLGNHQIDMDGTGLRALVVKSNIRYNLFSYKFSIEDIINYEYATDSKIKDNFIYYSPFSYWTLNIPLYGNIELNPLEYSNYSYIDVRADLDFNDGTVYYQVVAGDFVANHEVLITACTSNIFTQLPVAAGNLTVGEKIAKGVISAAVDVAALAIFPKSAIVKTVVGASTAKKVISGYTKHRTIQKWNKDKGGLKTIGASIETKTPIEENRTYSGREDTREYSYDNKGEVLQRSLHTVQNALNMQSGSATTVHISNTASSLNNTFCYFSCYVSDYRLYKDFGKLTGFQVMGTHKLDEMRGTTLVNNIHLEIPCLSEEISEIENLLYSGVIIRGHIENEVTT